MIRCLKAKCLARSLIESRSDGLHLLIGDRREVAAFGKVLPDQTIGVFVQAAFPTVIWMRKVEVSSERLGYCFVGGELSAVI